MSRKYTKDEQIAALREALLRLLNQPAGMSMDAIKTRREAQETGHAIYCATAPDWQKADALKLAQSMDASIETYLAAIVAYGRSILTSTERH